MAGYACEIDKILVKKYKLKLIEDCAHSVGTKYKSIHVEILEYLGVSLYPLSKLLLERGMLLK